MRFSRQDVLPLARKAAAIIAIAAGTFPTSSVALVWAQQETPIDTKAANPKALQTETWIDQLDTVLRDQSKDAHQRISEALALIEREKALGTKSTPSPSRDNEIDRVPWLSEGEELDWFSPFAGRWDPWREMQEMRARMDRLFQQAWRRMNEQARQFGQFGGRFSPMGEFEEKDDAYVYRFDLPNVGKDDVQVTVENGRLIIEGKRESRVDEDRKGFARREIFYGHFRRDILLPPDADTNNAKTKLENGVLTIEVPWQKSAGTSTKRELKIL